MPSTWRQLTQSESCFAIGFETIARPMPWRSRWPRASFHLSVLVSRALPPAITAIPEPRRVQGFLARGTLARSWAGEYIPLAERYHVPIVITGFEPLDLLEGAAVVQQRRPAGPRWTQYSRAVRPEGNPESRKIIETVFEICDRKWRGVGSIPQSGYRLHSEYAEHDAEQLFQVDDLETQESKVCISGAILRGLRKPNECPAFGKECAPQTPLGATMVSAEGACAAYYAYRRNLETIGTAKVGNHEASELPYPQAKT